MKGPLWFTFRGQMEKFLLGPLFLLVSFRWLNGYELQQGTSKVVGGHVHQRCP